MSDPYIGEIRMFGGDFAPTGWALCDGQLMSIQENNVLFSLIGTIYGGDGETTFALPDLRGRFPAHPGPGGGQNFTVGEVGGTETVTLSQGQLPKHSHPIKASSTAASTSPAGAAPAAWSGSQYSTSAPGDRLNVAAGGFTGGSQPHENRSPYLAVSYIISLAGIFPSQS